MQLLEKHASSMQRLTHSHANSLPPLYFLVVVWTFVGKAAEPSLDVKATLAIGAIMSPEEAFIDICEVERDH